MISILQRFKPEFWDYLDVASGPYKHLFNFRRIWYLSVLLTAGVAFIPVCFLAAIDYQVTQKAIESENVARTSRLISNTRRSISFLLLERRYALQFLVRDNHLKALTTPGRLGEVLKNLQESFGGFTDLGVINTEGRQIDYSGPYDLKNLDYSRQKWFAEVLDQGSYTSDVFLGYRQSPHLVIAVRHRPQNGPSYVLRATLEAERFHHELMSSEQIGDMFIVNRDGILQTPSRTYGKILEKISLPVPEYSATTQVFDTNNFANEKLLIGYAYIAETPFVLMVVKNKDDLMRPWYKARRQLITYLLISISSILIVVLAVSTYSVSKIYTADQTRVATLHQVEYANKMASIGRLAAGVAHEINNPLAIINEKTGLIKDLLQQENIVATSEKLLAQTDSILRSVKRCATIIRRLLSFARQTDSTFEPIELKEVIENVIGFLGKEADYRNIDINIDLAPDIPPFQSDRGKLEQIFLNLVNNAFAALDDGGHLTFKGRKISEKRIQISVIDDGCGIAQEDIKRVFDPFFSTRTKQGGTGLGLSITYGLIQEIGGTISVDSRTGKGTSFIITLPLNLNSVHKKNENNECVTG
ncbi:MAG: two-component sensor histidine kinase [Deltaproteobacteria bacterium]|nr:two-component sensor histidine kinase [Deltaproteobacteria bacterium]